MSNSISSPPPTKTKMASVRQQTAMNRCGANGLLPKKGTGGNPSPASKSSCPWAANPYPLRNSRVTPGQPGILPSPSMFLLPTSLGVFPTAEHLAEHLTASRHMAATASCCLIICGSSVGQARERQQACIPSSPPTVLPYLLLLYTFPEFLPQDGFPEKSRFAISLCLRLTCPSQAQPISSTTASTHSYYSITTSATTPQPFVLFQNTPYKTQLIILSANLILLLAHTSTQASIRQAPPCAPSSSTRLATRATTTATSPSHTAAAAARVADVVATSAAAGVGAIPRAVIRIIPIMRNGTSER